MSWYRHKPTVIEARQFTVPGDGIGIAAWCGGQFLHNMTGSPIIVIQTREGEMIATPGMWILHGVKNEWYPVSDEVFQAAYEPARVPDGVGTGAE